MASYVQWLIRLCQILCRAPFARAKGALQVIDFIKCDQVELIHPLFLSLINQNATLSHCRINRLLKTTIYPQIIRKIKNNICDDDGQPQRDCPY